MVNGRVKYKIKDVFDLSAGGDVDRDHFSTYKTSEHRYPIYSNSLENHGLYGYTSNPRYCANSVTITGRGSVGHAEYREEAFDAIIRLLVLEPKDNRVYSRFVADFINNCVDFPLESTGVPQLTAPQIMNIELELPQYGEQKEIADLLADVNSLIEMLEKQISKKKAIKQGAMQELLTGKKRLPGFSGKWVSGKWKDALDCFSSGATPYRGNTGFYNGSIKWVSSGELNYNRIMDTMEHISNEAKTKANLIIHPKGTFLMAITGLEAAGTRGSCAILGTPATTNQSCMAIYGTNKMSTEYLFHYYVQHGDELALQYCQGTKQQSYTATIVKELPIYYPGDIAEQNAIASLLTDMDDDIKALEQKLEKYRQVKQGMMQQLLTGKIRLV